MMPILKLSVWSSDYASTNREQKKLGNYLMREDTKLLPTWEEIVASYFLD